MSSKIFESKLLGEKYHRIEHSSGLTVFVYPKENIRSTYAVFGTKYGAIDRCFKRTDEAEVQETPAGIAHFLEHKLFDGADGDASAEFAKLGAFANASTSFETTKYLFSCTENYTEALEILLNFVQSPYFTEETIQKEIGIISQEIKMYEDNPHWRLMRNTFGALFQNHPVKESIAGTVESILKITPQHLYHCYETFYDLSNMILCIAGSCTVDEVLSVCDKTLKCSNGITAKRVFENEPDEVTSKRVEEALQVSIPMFQLGFKERIRSDYRTEKEFAAAEILLEILASDSSPLYRRLLDANLINEASFSNTYFECNGCATVIFGGESNYPDAVCEEIRKEIRKIKREGVSNEDVRRAARSLYGANIYGLNNPEVLANAVMSMEFSGREMFRYIESFRDITADDVNARIDDIFDEDGMSVSIAWPANKNN